MTLVQPNQPWKELQAPKKAEPGTVIHGTHRMQDLIPAFFDAVRSVHPEAARKWFDYSIEYLPPELEYHEVGALQWPEAADPWWDSEDADLVHLDLYEMLEHLAPETCYFGPHPGDGSDIGFWEV